MVPQRFQRGVHVFLRPRFRAVVMRAGLAGMAPGVVLAGIRVDGASRRHQAEQLRRDHHHVVAVGRVLRADARAVRHVAVDVDRVRRVHRVQRFEFYLHAVTVLNLCKQIRTYNGNPSDPISIDRLWEARGIDEESLTKRSKREPLDRPLSTWTVAKGTSRSEAPMRALNEVAWAVTNGATQI